MGFNNYFGTYQFLCIQLLHFINLLNSYEKNSFISFNIFIDNEHDTTNNDLLWAQQQQHVSTVASTSKDQILNICGDNVIDSQINTQSSSPKTSPFLTKTANISDDNLTLVTGKLLFTYIQVLNYNLGTCISCI